MSPTSSENNSPWANEPWGDPEDEWDESQPAAGEWIAAVLGLVLVVGLFAVWLTQFNGADSSEAAASTDAAAAGEVFVAGTVQENSSTSTTESDAPSTTETPTTTLPMTPTEVAGLVSAQLGREQQCGSVAPPDSVVVSALPGGVMAALVTCSPGRARVVEVITAGDELLVAPLLVELYDRTGRVAEQTGDITGTVTLDELGNLTIVDAQRETNDCGVRHETEWNGARFELRAAAGRFDCAPEPLFAGLEWPVVFPANERLACVPGESTSGDGELVTYRNIDVDGDGQLDVLSLLRRGSATFVRADLASGAVYQSGLSDSTPIVGETFGLADLDGDGFGELFVTMTTSAGDVDLVLTRTDCGWLVAGQLTQVAEQIVESNYRCLPVDGATEIVMTASSAIPGTSPARFLHTSERFRIVNGLLELQGINRSELDQPDIEARGDLCVS